jgi:hypothetical protein
MGLNMAEGWMRPAWKIVHKVSRIDLALVARTLQAVQVKAMAVAYAKEADKDRRCALVNCAILSLFASSLSALFAPDERRQERLNAAPIASVSNLNQW